MTADGYLASLVQYGIQHRLIEESDRTFIFNQLLDALSLREAEAAEPLDLPLEEILKGLLDDAVRRGVCADDITSCVCCKFLIGKSGW